MGKVAAIVRKKLFLYGLIFGLLNLLLLATADSAYAAAGINSQVNFQGRLYTAAGATVPDGYYNLEFKIYQDGDGLTAGDTTGTPTGSLKWTEDYLGQAGNGVLVKNGFLSVQLGSINAFGSQVDWNQSTLWLSMNVAGTSASCATFSACTPDGEMTPMKRLSANAYALNAGQLGGLTSAGFIQNTSTPQTANFNISGIGTATQLVVSDGTVSTHGLNFASGVGLYATSNSLSVADGTGAGFLYIPKTGEATIGSSQGVASGARFRVDNGSTASAFLVQSNGAGRTSINGDGSTNVKGDSANVFSIQNTSNDTLLNVATTTNVITLGNTALATGTQTINVGTANTAGGTTNVTIGSGTSATAGTTTLQAKTSVLIGNASTPTITLQSGAAGSLNFGTNAVSNTIQVGTTATNTGNTQAINIGNLAVAGTSNVTIGSSTGATAGTTTLQAATSLVLGNAVAPTITMNTASGGTLNIGSNAVSNTIQIGSTTLASGTQTISVGNNNTAGGTTNVTIGAGASATAGSTALQAKTNITLATNGIIRANLDNAGNLYLGNGVVAGAPSNFTVSGTGSNATGVTGATLNLQGGNATVGNANGGNLNLTGGSGFGTGINGLVVFSTPTFSTAAADANCYTGGALVSSSCTISAASVNGSSAIIVGFSAGSLSASLPSPGITTAGRVVYITAANGSSDFTLLVNGGGTGNSIAMRQNTTATMIWNGSAWTAAGASSSTTLQSAYDNTLQSAGGAELVVSKTGNTNGLTIRDSASAPVNGTLLSVQTASAAGLFSVNSNVTEYATNGGAETAGGSSSTFPASTWSASGSSTVSRFTTAGNFIATGQASVSTLTTTAANDGVKDTLSTSLTANTTYNVSFAARLASGTFTDMNVYYSINGTTASVACTTSQAIATSIWTKVNCSFVAPASGITSTNAILIRQTAAGSARTFYVENLSVTIAADYNYATDGGVDDNTNFATNWSAVAASTVTRDTTVGNDASDSTKVVTTATAGQGVRNKLSINPLTGTLYRITVYTSSLTSGFNDFTIRYSRDGGTNYVACADYNSQIVSSSTTAFSKITCYITTDGTAASNPYVYFTQATGTARTFYVDTFSMTLNGNSTPNVQIGGGVNGGPTTLLTLDKGASAPIAVNNDALLGSMYYDTTLGKLQCYESDGWGACGSSPDNVVTISPEYTNAVMHGTGVGTMTSDLCSGTLDINDGTSSQPTICGALETYNFYKWTSPQASTQTYSIYVTYQLPGTFKSFSSGQTSLMGRTDSANSTVNYQIYKNDATTGLTSCGSSVAVSSGSVSSWQTGLASGAADPSTCSFAPGNSIVFKINVSASSNASAYVGNLNFIFTNK